MDIDDFLQTLDRENPPEGAGPLLAAMWYDARNEWTTAHQIAQDINSSEAGWVHAYLHRKEGDEWNAGYWYKRAGKPFPETTLDQEWRAIVRALLGSGNDSPQILNNP